METKNNSEFMSQVDAFSEEMQKFIEKSDKRHALLSSPLSLTKTGKAHVKPGLSWEMKKKSFTL